MKIRILFIALLFSAVSWGQASIASIGTPYTQNFDGLSNTGTANTWTDGTTLLGWYAKTTFTPTFTVSTYAANTGSSVTGSLCSFGSVSPATDRTLGMANSNGFTGPSGSGKGYYGCRLKNNTGVAISSLTIVWTGEQWRKSGTLTAQTLLLSYQTSTSAITDLIAGTWTSTGSSFSSPINTAGAAALDGNVGTNRTANITFTLSVSLAAGDEIMLRWEDLNDSGSDNFMGIDDVSVTATGVYTAVSPNGDWSTAATWDLNAVPTAGSNVIIPATKSVYLTGNVTRNAGTTTTVAIGGTLATADIGVANTNAYANNGTTTINGTFRVEGDGSASGNNFVYGAAGTLNFNNNSSSVISATFLSPNGKVVSNTDVFWPTSSGPYNVGVIGDISITSGAARTVTGLVTTGTKITNGITSTGAGSLIVNGTLRIDNGGGFGSTAASAPIYGASSLLLYNTGIATTNRGNEWTVGSGTIGTTAGYPNNVQISNNTTVRCNTTSTQRGMASNFTIDSGSTFDMTAGSLPTVDFLVGGSVINNGTFKFSTSLTTPASIVVTGDYSNNGTTTMANTLPTSGGHLKIGGNFSNGASGVFTGNNKSVYFTKTSGTQTVQNLSASALVFPYVLTASTATTIQLLNDLTISSPNAAVNGGVALTLVNSGDVFDLNGKTLTIGTAAVVNTISVAGSFKGSTTSGLILKGGTVGTPSIGTLKFATNLNLGTFTMNRFNAGVGCVMGSALTVITALNLTAGLIDLGAYTMTLENGVNPSGSTNSYIIADVNSSEVGGKLTKSVSAGGSHLFPIGDATASTNGSQYTPATVNFTAGTFDATSYVTLGVNDAKESNLIASTDYLTRYWTMTTAGTFASSPTYTFDGTYDTTGTNDVTGTISTYFKSNQWDGAIPDWINGGTIIGGAPLLRKTGCTTVGTTANHITAGIRNQEIEVKSGVAGITILNGTTTTNGNAAYGTQTIGSNTAHTFSIYNRGGVSLTVGAITISGANASDFVVTTLPSSPVTAESSTTFVITFTPSYAGYRTATVSIVNNDSDENPYTFVIDGTGDCAVAASNTITPTSGPVGTEVTITAVTNNLYSATASINGVSATISNYSPAMATATVIKAIIPATAVSGSLVTTNNLGCQASNVFTVLDNASTSCEGGSTASELFMSEVTDSNSGSLTYIEIYNGTSSAKNLGTYSIKVANNGGAYTLAMTLSSVSLAVGSTYVVAMGNDSACGNPGGNGSYAAQTSVGSSINFAVGGNDHYGLFNGATLIDSWGTFGSTNWAPTSISTEGATFRRKNTATLPSTTYSNSDWNIVDYLGSGSSYCANNDYSNIGTYNFRAGVPPVVSTLTYTPTCKATTLTVTATEGFSGSNPLVYNWYAVQNGSNTWNLISNGGIYSGATTNALVISDISTLTDYQFYCQVNENTATCYIASNAIKITPSQATTWQAGNTWTNGVPTINTAVTIDNNYDTTNGFSPSFDACSLTINSGKTVTIRANDYANIQNDLTVTGSLNVENNGSLVMIDDNGVVTNTGTTNIKRTATGIRGFDYVYWSSPVTGQSLSSIYSSPTPGYMFYWDPVVANINSPISTGNWIAASGTMSPAKGYIVRGSSSYGMAASSIPSVFTGAVNNGVIQAPIGRGGNQAASTTGSGNGVTVTNYDDNWNLVGNPYASAINAIDFLNYNTNLQGFVYLWKHNNAPVSLPDPFYSSFLYDYNPSDYLAYNKLGAQTQNGFGGYIASGQGFFILMNDGVYDTSQTATFKNSMRSKTYGNTQFYRTTSPSVASSTEEEKHRIWLDLVDSNNQSVRTLVGYASGATIGLDRLYDAFKNTANTMSIHSLVEDKTYIIQGRPVPFDDNDQVPIGVTVKLAGTYKIAIAAVDGLFSDPAQNIYLEDKQLGVIYDLRQSPYTFDSAVGIFNDRFVLRYNGNTLSNPDFGSADNTIIVSANHGQMNIKSSVEAIQDVTVYDILGRQLFESKSIDNTTFSASNISMSQQALIVKIKLKNGNIVSKKVIL